jgi:hypothetical protein
MNTAVCVRVCVSSGSVLAVSNVSRYVTLVSCCSDTHCTQFMRCLLGLRLVTTFIFFPHSRYTAPDDVHVLPPHSLFRDIFM